MSTLSTTEYTATDARSGTVVDRRGLGRHQLVADFDSADALQWTLDIGSTSNIARGTPAGHDRALSSPPPPSPQESP